jgi:hypothetical protein
MYYLHHKIYKKMKKNILFQGILTFIYFVPIVTFAAFEGIKGFLGAFKALINPVIAIIAGLAVVYFFWGIAQFVLHAGDQKTHEAGKNRMIWGIVALFVMFSIWGIINWIGAVVGISPNETQSTTGSQNNGLDNINPNFQNAGVIDDVAQ